MNLSNSHWDKTITTSIVKYIGKCESNIKKLEDDHKVEKEQLSAEINSLKQLIDESEKQK